MGIRLARIVGVFVVSGLAFAARLPSGDVGDRELSGHFEFLQKRLDELPNVPRRQTRDVHRDLKHIQPWISSVGAAAALGDIDGDLISNDICYVDTRINRVIVASLAVPPAYPAFSLDAPESSFDPKTVAPMGCLIGDLNEDGRPDLLVYYWGRPPVAFLALGDSDGHSRPLRVRREQYKAFEIGKGHPWEKQRWFTNAATFADIDGDGHADLIIGNYFCDDGRILDPNTKEPVCPHPVMQDSMSRAYNGGRNRLLLWSSGRGGPNPQVAYQDVSDALPEDIANAWTLAIGAQDLNGDLLPEIYFANDFGPDRLLVNCSRAEESFAQSRRALGCFPLEGPVSFRLIEGRKTFTKPNSKVLGRDSFKGMGVDFADLNGDGIPDIYVSNITEKWALQESQFLFLSDGRKLDATLVRDGIAPYSDESESLGLSRSGWAWDAKLADFDNDGQPEALQAVGFVRGKKSDSGLTWRKSCWAVLQELATANDALLSHAGIWFDMAQDESGIGCDLSGDNRNPFFTRNSSGRYVNISQRLKHIDEGDRAVTRGIAIADINQDGLLDYVEAKQFGASSLYVNQSPLRGKNGFLGIIPRIYTEGDSPNMIVDRPTGASVQASSRPAIGATVRVILPDGRTLTQQVDGGNGHSGKRSPEVHFGLGSVHEGETATVEVAWRYGVGKPRIARFDGVKLNQYHVIFLQPLDSRS